MHMQIISLYPTMAITLNHCKLLSHDVLLVDTPKYSAENFNLKRCKCLIAMAVHIMYHVLTLAISSYFHLTILF